MVVNVQGDEPLIAPELIDRTAEVLVENNVQMATAAHELHDFDEFMNPNVVKVVLDKNRNAIYFSRAPIPYPRDAMRAEKTRIARRNRRPAPYRHLRLPRRFSATLRRNERLAAGNHRITGATARPVARLPDCRETAKEAPAAGVDTQEDLDRGQGLRFEVV